MRKNYEKIFSQRELFMCREYYLHPRPNGIYYVEFKDKVSGKKLTARSTGETDKFKAHLRAELWLVNGIPAGRSGKPRSIEEIAGIESVIKTIRKANLNADDALRIVSVLKSMGLIDIAAVKNTGRGAVPFVQFLETFWDFDKSEYIRDQLAHGFRFGRNHAYQCQIRLSKNIKPFFSDKKLNCVTTDDLEKFTIKLANAGFSTMTIYQHILICSTALKWAFNKKIISANPAIGLSKFSITSKERGILTETEAAAVFAVAWKDKRAFVASLVAVTTGARLGECLVLRRSDIGTDTLDIAHSYSYLGGLKCPKNGKKRVVPLLPEVRIALLDLLKDNPHDVDDPFVLFSLLPDRPIDPKVILKGFKKALDTVNTEYLRAAQKANLEKPEIQIDYKSRNIVFHSWRHYFCSKITQQIEGEKVAKVSGHLSEAVFKKYADHIERKNIKEVGDAAAQAFGNVLQFRKVS
jgi:integrase